MVPPLLKLSILQGPREGDSLEYKPGSTVRIGRYVRGNEISIKDAGISTKHLQIDSDSENWRIYDLGSSNGTILNSDTLDPHTHVNLRHGDVIKLGEYSSLAVNFETDVEAQEHKLPPMPRRSNRRLPVADPDPVHMDEKPTGKGKSAKQDADEPRRRGRPPKRKAMEEIADKEKESDVENDKEVNCRVTRSRKKVAITKEEEEEEVPLEKKGNSRARGGKKNTEAAQNLGLNSIKLEIEDRVEISAMKKRATRSRQTGNESMGSEENIKSEDTDTATATATALEEKRPTRATRSKRKEIGGDVVPNQAPKSRAKKRKTESKSVVVEEMEARNEDDDDEDKENEKAVVEPESEKEDETIKSVELEQVEIELRNSRLGEEDLNSSVREVGEAEKLQDTVEEERDRNSEVGVAGTETSDGGGCEGDEEKAEQELRNKKNVDKLEVDLEKMTLGDWFKFMRVQLRKQIIEETEKMIEPMTSKSLRVHQHIAQHKQAKGKGSVS